MNIDVTRFFLETSVCYNISNSVRDMTCVIFVLLTHTGCSRRNGPDFGRVFLRSYYTDITQNTYIQS